MASSCPSTPMTPAVTRRGRKRLRVESEWKRKKMKLQKDRGEAYTTYTGTQKPSKEVKNLTCKCQYSCREKLDEKERERLFTDFYKLGEYDTQNKYLFGLLGRMDVKRKKRCSATSRKNTIVYHVRLVDGTRVQVCKKSFCDLHSIGKRRVENLIDKLVNGVFMGGDERGKHSSRPHAIPEVWKDKVREHIQSIPRRQSHYSRTSNRKKEYLPEQLSIARLYHMYLDKYEAQAKESGTDIQIKEWLYRKIFNEEFNLSFGYPRSDTCEICDELHMAIRNSKSDPERDSLKHELASHQETASQGYQSLRNDKEAARQKNDSVLLTFDLMQNLPVPTLTHNSMFYSRQLWEYNFGIHDCGTNKATMCMWSAGRGADEICSCLHQYITNLPPQVKKLTCFSDSCFGQNKNFQMICFWNWQGRFSQVDHKFLVRGHTYLPNDRDFSHIEKRKDSAVIYTPSDWETVVQEACVKKPFIVKRMDQSEFYEFANITNQHTHRKKDSIGKGVLISKARWMNFGQTDSSGRVIKHPNEVWIRYSYSMEESWSKVNLLKGRKNTQPLISVSLPIKYPNGHPILLTKIQDLKKMIPFIPDEYKQFYIDLVENPDGEQSE